MIFNEQGATKRKFKFYFQEREIEIVKQYTYQGFKFIPSGKNQEIENLMNKAKKSWFIRQRFLYTSVGKAVNTYLNLILFQPLSKKEKLHSSLSLQIVRVKNNTSSSKVLGKLGRFPFRISIETRLFKYLQRIRLGDKTEIPAGLLQYV